MKILYLPIIEPGDAHATALINKRGLRDALEKYGPVTQLDYLAIPQSDLFKVVYDMLAVGEYGMLLTQLHGVDRLSADNFKAIRAKHPTLKIINWSGDSWLHSLTSPEMLDLCHQFDLQLVAAPDVLPVYEASGIRARFWQIAFEKSVGPLPDMPHYDVVFLGNVISDKRRALLEFLRTLDGVSVGIYGDWEHADGRNVYDFGAGEALYKNAKIAIADCAYPDQVNYVSNRPIQILMAGGALLLHEYVPKMDVLLGIEDGVHFRGWNNFDELRARIDYETLCPRGLTTEKIVQVGQTFAREHHTYDARVNQLFNEYLLEVEGAH